MPFLPGSFDIVYSAGLLHELDVGKRAAEEALAALASAVRPGGRLATSDFVNTEPAVQLEDEGFQADLAREVFGRELYGIGPPERLVALHEKLLVDARWRVSPPWPVRHLDKVVLDEDEPEALSSLPPEIARRLRDGRVSLTERIRREGYTRPATLYVDGLVSDG
jgi:SAM-dependent methyltransferase